MSEAVMRIPMVDEKKSPYDLIDVIGWYPTTMTAAARSITIDIAGFPLLDRIDDGQCYWNEVM